MCPKVSIDVASYGKHFTRGHASRPPSRKTPTAGISPESRSRSRSRSWTKSSSWTSPADSSCSSSTSYPAGPSYPSTSSPSCPSFAWTFCPSSPSSPSCAFARSARLRQICLRLAHLLQPPFSLQHLLVLPLARAQSVSRAFRALLRAVHRLKHRPPALIRPHLLLVAVQTRIAPHLLHHLRVSLLGLVRVAPANGMNGAVRRGQSRRDARHSTRLRCRFPELRAGVLATREGTRDAAGRTHPTMEDQRSETFRALEVVTLRIGRAFGGEGEVSDTRSERSRRGRRSAGAAREGRRAPVTRGHGHASRGGRHGSCTRANRAIRARASVVVRRRGCAPGVCEAKGADPPSRRGAPEHVYTRVCELFGFSLIVTCAVDVIE